MIEVLGGFGEAGVRMAVPLLIAAVGECLAERSGVLNLSVEGSMIAGALASALAASSTGEAWVGMAAGAAAGALLALLFALFALGLAVDMIISGVAVNIAAFGLTGALYRGYFGPEGARLTLPTFSPLPLGSLASIPLVGGALFRQAAPAYVGFLLVPLLWWFFFRTGWGLRLRAAGEAPTAAEAQGVPVLRLRTLAVVAGGALAGYAGAFLVVAHAGTFAEGMTAGRGFIALAVVALGRWHPFGVLAAALFFGGAGALQFLFQALGVALPYQVFLMLPYVLTLLALAGGAGRSLPPAALGLPYRPPR